MKKRRQRANVKDRKISFGDFQTETIGISVKKILIEVPSIKYKMISAIGNAGDLFFMFHKETMNTDIFKDFILRLTTDIEIPVFLIVDNLRVHHAKILQNWLDEQWEKTRFKLFYLPSYSPELNPDEYLNRDVKAHLAETKISKTADELTEAVRSHLSKKDKASIKRLFHKPEVRYAAEEST